MASLIESLQLDERDLGHERIALADDEVHVWIAAWPSCGIPARTGQDNMTRAHETARVRGILGRYATRTADALAFDIGPRGKPSLVPTPGAAPLEFNLSHSGDLIALAVARHAVGIDIERIAPIPEIETLVADCLSDAELRAWRSVEPALRLDAFYRLWTRKEACLKVVGAGLHTPLRDVDTSTPAGLAGLAGVGHVADWRHDAGHHLALASAVAAPRIVNPSCWPEPRRHSPPPCS